MTTEKKYKIRDKSLFKDEVIRTASKYCDMVDCMGDDFPHGLKLEIKSFGFRIIIDAWDES